MLQNKRPIIIQVAMTIEIEDLLKELDERSQTLKDGTWYEMWREKALSWPSKERAMRTYTKSR